MNREIVENVKRRDSTMRNAWMNIFEPEINERVNTAVTTAVDNNTRTNLFLYVQDGDMLIEKAAKRANMSTADFSTAMTNAGYKLPQMANR